MILQIREFRPGDEKTLRAVFLSSVHELAGREYSQQQLDAWAPRHHDELEWSARIQRLQPLIAEMEGAVVAYADLQPSGYIDHFYVAGSHARRGVGSALMEHIHATALARGMSELWAEVSLTAEPFFAKWGFVAETRNSVVARGVQMFNIRMRKRLDLQGEPMAPGVRDL